MLSEGKIHELSDLLSDHEVLVESTNENARNSFPIQSMKTTSLISSCLHPIENVAQEKLLHCYRGML